MYQQHYQVNFLHAPICKNKINRLTRTQQKARQRFEDGKINQTLTCDSFVDISIKDRPIIQKLQLMCRTNSLKIIMLSSTLLQQGGIYG